MKKIILLCALIATLSADFHNELYSKVCYTIAHNRVDLQPAGLKAEQIRAEIVNRAYVTSKVVIWEREDHYDFPALVLIEDEVIKHACEDTLNIEKTANSNEFVFYTAYQKAVYKHTVDALMKIARPKK